MKIERLAWDSDFFGLEVGRLNLDAGFDSAMLETVCARSGFDVIYICLDQPTGPEIEALEAVAPLYDRKLIYRKDVVSVASEMFCGVSEYNKPLSDELLELAFISGGYSRYKLDPRFKPQFEKLYRVWIENALAGDVADVVLVSSVNARLAGFITLAEKNQTGQIGLLAVHPDFQRQGVASSLMMAADAWFCARNCREAVVVTQRANQPACRLYEHYGFKLDVETAVFHCWTAR